MVDVHVDEVALDSLIGRVRAMSGYRDEIVDALSAGARVAADTMRELVPKETGRLAESIQAGPVTYVPGGAGGGGFYEFAATAGENVPYSNITVEGRGSITAPSFGKHVAALYKKAPRSRAKYMVFAGTKLYSGFRIFALHVKGYSGRTDWIEAAQIAANEAVERKLDDIERGI